MLGRNNLEADESLSGNDLIENAMDKFVDFHKQLMQHNIDDVMSYIDFLKMFATDEETIAKINALWYCRICLE